MSDGGGRRGRAGGPGGVSALDRHVLSATLAALLLCSATEARATVLAEDEFEEESTELGVIARA